LNGILFIDTYTCIMTNLDNEILRYDVNGTFLGRFAEHVDEPHHVTKVDDDTIAISAFDGVHFVDLEGKQTIKYRKISGVTAYVGKRASDPRGTYDGS